MKIVVLDGYTLNPGDLSWASLEAMGETVIYDRTSLTITGKSSKESVMRMLFSQIKLLCPKKCWSSVAA